MIQHPGILKNNIYHLSKRGPPPFFHSGTNLVLGNVLVYPVEKTHVLVVRGRLIWLLPLNILFFNYVQTPNKSHRFRKFRRSYTCKTRCKIQLNWFKWTYTKTSTRHLYCTTSCNETKKKVLFSIQHNINVYNTYTSLFLFKPTAAKCGFLFFGQCALLKATICRFLLLFAVTIVHLRNLFLLSTLVAQMLLTPRWVSRLKDVEYLFINIW